MNKKTYTVWGNPIAKPRMTRSDKWKKRPCVVKYREYKDRIRDAVKDIPDDIDMVHILCFFELPKSWSQNKKTELMGTAHRQRPDCDNVLKGVLDALLQDDSGVYDARVQKYWDDSAGARTEIIIEGE